MNKIELVKQMSARTGVSPISCRAVMDALKSIIKEELSAGNKVTYKGFFTAVSLNTKERMMHDIQTKELKLLPAATVIRIRPSRLFKLTESK